MDTLKQYEHAAMLSLQEACERGEEAPETVSVWTHIHGVARFFLVPRKALPDVRRAIIGEGGSYRVSFI